MKKELIDLAQRELATALDDIRQEQRWFPAQSEYGKRVVLGGEHTELELVVTVRRPVRPYGLDPNGHLWDAWTVSSSPGTLYERKCTNCGARQWFEPEAKGMEWHGQDQAATESCRHRLDRDGSDVRDLRDGVHDGKGG